MPAQIDLPLQVCIGYRLETMTAQGRFVDGSPFQAAAGSTRNLTAEAGDALEAAGFHRLGGAPVIWHMQTSPAWQTRLLCLM